MLVSDPDHLFLDTNGQPRIGHILSQTSQGTSGSSNLLISMAVMLFLVLLLANSFEGISGAGQETLCTSNACYTLNMVNGSFEAANQNCTYNGGYLMTVRDREEEDVLRLLLSQIKRQHREKGFKFWIGLKRHSGDCLSSDQETKSLRGFKWVSGEEDSHYSNWEKEPANTCMERCVMVRDKQLKWTAGSCKSSIFYACKFYFKGMCKPLALSGPGEITYTLPFSQEPQRLEMQSLPLGTYADISCSDTQHDTLCMFMDGVYHWKDPGPFCKQNCMINNGGCEHLCHSGTDQVHCSCKEGYSLDKNGFTCRTKELCPNGFQLDADQRTCSDIDECQSQICEHLCINTHGNYTCVCKDGYQMVGGKCSDIDECTQRKCEHGCSNSIGSYSCYCRQGFTLSEDGHSCVDTNECVSNRCQFKCVNTNGSFLCTCPQGFHVETDGLTCTPEVTETSVPSSESLTRTTVELQHQSPHTDAPPPELVNITQSNTSSVASFAKTFNSRVIICVLGSVIPLLILVAVTLAIMIFRCSRTKKEAKKNTTTDGYCWVSSGLDPRLEKLYESILTDDL